MSKINVLSASSNENIPGLSIDKFAETAHSPEMLHSLSDPIQYLKIKSKPCSGNNS